MDVQSTSVKSVPVVVNIQSFYVRKGTSVRFTKQSHWSDPEYGEIGVLWFFYSILVIIALVEVG